ncbi:unnamed protein product [Psylliodes chrysocephalus]|uniref:Uncharacterized protein n=1 Tax=Psylliodes chrysocephalus TaxID=3402493 RepID=A0A9P0CBN1_9CUCU|nr:unnamed protein product [Psylliodes chrysocephala]
MSSRARRMVEVVLCKDQNQPVNEKENNHQQVITDTFREKQEESFMVVVACLDMKAVFQLPKGDTSIFYYRSKLNTMNLTITGLAKDETWCFVWHEGEGGKGVTEVASCFTKKGEPYRVKELTHEDFVNIKQLMTDLGPNFNINSDEEQIPIYDLNSCQSREGETIQVFFIKLLLLN